MSNVTYKICSASVYHLLVDLGIRDNVSTKVKDENCYSH